MAVDLDFEFDPSTLPPDDRERLSVGRYLVQCIDTTMEDTKTGSGRKLVAIFEVLDGSSQGRKWYENYNLRNESPDAERIGNQQFERFKVAVGFGGVSMRNTGPLEFKPFYIDIGERKNNRTGEMERVIKSYSPYGASAGSTPPNRAQGYRPQPQGQQAAAPQPAPQTQAAQQAVPQQPAAAGTRPWRR